MTEIPQRRSRRRPILSGLFASVAGIAATAWVYQITTYRLPEDTFSPEAVGGLAIAAVMCWFGMLSNDGGWGDALSTAAGRVFAAAGFVLLAQYPLAYFFLLIPTDWPIIVFGCMAAGALCALFDYAAARRSQKRSALLVGFDRTAAALADILPGALSGVLDEDPACVPASLRYRGQPGQLREALAETGATMVVLNGQAWRRRLTPGSLLRLREAGIEICDGPALYESALARVPWHSRHPVELLLDAAPNQFRSVSAIQAVYTNVIGLSLLLALSPFFVLTAIAILAFSPGGRVIERVECVGYQGVPFRLLRFRVRNRTGEISFIGKLISLLHAENLPRLINVVRGEMALFGPPPVRRDFAHALSALMPPYPHRFLVKPGVSGWSQINMRADAADEALRLEYDLYYVKMGSAMLDASILLRLVFRAAMVWIPSRPPARTAEAL